jgi:antitoxin (DNA-binding transcriptional repressor) of toxin-antitoxin stability system
MITIALDEAPGRLGTLLEDVEERGEVVVICRGDRPIAELRPATPTGPLPMHPQLSRVRFHEDPVAPLDPEDWPDSEP